MEHLLHIEVDKNGYVPVEGGRPGMRIAAGAIPSLVEDGLLSSYRIVPDYRVRLQLTKKGVKRFKSCFCR